MKTTPSINLDRVRFSINARFNPIRFLTPDLLSRYLDNFQLGYLRDLAVTYDAMERRDSFIRNCALKRKKSVARQKWEVLTTEDTPAAKEQKEVLDFFYNHITASDWMQQNRTGGMALLIRQMMDAVGKGFAVHEIVFKTKPAQAALDDAGTPGEQRKFREEMLTAQFTFCPLWWFENRRGKLRLLPQEFAIEGVDMPDGEWLVTVGEGIMEPSAVAYMFKHLSMKDWVSYTEKFAFPLLKGTTTAQKGSSEWDVMIDALKTAGNDNAVLVNAGENVEAIELGGQGNDIYKSTVEYFDRAIASIWRGADLSTISSGASGEGHGASVQGDETNLLLEDDCELISETLQTQVDRFVLRYYFGDAEQLAYVKVLPPKKVDAQIDVAVDTFLVGSGFPVSHRSASERYGRELPEAGEPLLTKPAAPMAGPVGAPDQANEGPARVPAVQVHRLAAAFAEDLQPLRSRIERILSIEDPDILRSKLESLRNQLPQLLSDMNADPESARVLEDSLHVGLLKGVAEAREKQTEAA